MAKAFIARLRSLFEDAKPTDKPLVPPKARTRGKPDLDSPVLLFPPPKRAVGEESPLVNALAIRFDGHDLSAIRAQTIAHILALSD